MGISRFGGSYSSGKSSSSGSSSSSSSSSSSGRGITLTSPTGKTVSVSSKSTAAQLSALSAAGYTSSGGSSGGGSSSSSRGITATTPEGKTVSISSKSTPQQLSELQAAGYKIASSSSSKSPMQKTSSTSTTSKTGQTWTSTDKSKPYYGQQVTIKDGKVTPVQQQTETKTAERKTPTLASVTNISNAPEATVTDKLGQGMSIDTSRISSGVADTGLSTISKNVQNIFTTKPYTTTTKKQEPMFGKTTGYTPRPSTQESAMPTVTSPYVKTIKEQELSKIFSPKEASRIGEAVSYQATPTAMISKGEPIRKVSPIIDIPKQFVLGFISPESQGKYNYNYEDLTKEEKIYGRDFGGVPEWQRKAGSAAYELGRIANIPAYSYIGGEEAVASTSKPFLMSTAEGASKAIKAMPITKPFRFIASKSIQLAEKAPLISKGLTSSSKIIRGISYAVPVGLGTAGTVAAGTGTINLLTQQDSTISKKDLNEAYSEARQAEIDATGGAWYSYLPYGTVNKQQEFNEKVTESLRDKGYSDSDISQAMIGLQQKRAAMNKLELQTALQAEGYGNIIGSPEQGIRLQQVAAKQGVAPTVESIMKGKNWIQRGWTIAPSKLLAGMAEGGSAGYSFAKIRLGAEKPFTTLETTGGEYYNTLSDKNIPTKEYWVSQQEWDKIQSELPQSQKVSQPKSTLTPITGMAVSGAKSIGSSLVPDIYTAATYKPETTKTATKDEFVNKIYHIIGEPTTTEERGEPIITTELVGDKLIETTTTPVTKTTTTPEQVYTIYSEGNKPTKTKTKQGWLTATLWGAGIGAVSAPAFGFLEGTAMIPKGKSKAGNVVQNMYKKGISFLGYASDAPELAGDIATEGLIGEGITSQYTSPKTLDINFGKSPSAKSSVAAGTKVNLQQKASTQQKQSTEELIKQISGVQQPIKEQSMSKTDNTQKVKDITSVQQKASVFDITQVMDKVNNDILNLQSTDTSTQEKTNEKVDSYVNTIVPDKFGFGYIPFGAFPAGGGGAGYGKGLAGFTVTNPLRDIAGEFLAGQKAKEQRIRQLQMMKAYKQNTMKARAGRAAGRTMPKTSFLSGNKAKRLVS